MAACPIEVLVIMAALCPTMGSAVARERFESEICPFCTDCDPRPMACMRISECRECLPGYRVTEDTFRVPMYDGFSMSAVPNTSKEIPLVTNWKYDGETLPSTTLQEPGTNPWRTYAFYTFVAVCMLVVYHCYVKRRPVRVSAVGEMHLGEDRPDCDPRITAKIEPLKKSKEGDRYYIPLPNAKVFYTKESRLQQGSDGGHVFVGLLLSRDEETPVIIKRVVNVGREGGIIRSLKNQSLKKLEHLLIPIEIDDGDPPIEAAHYVSELCAWNVQEAIKQGLFLDKREQMCEELMEGVKDLHELGFTHRDIKPSNILVDLRGNVRLADFGISRTADQTITQTERMGSACWTSKVVLDRRDDGTEDRYYVSDDIQMVGCCLYYILTGHHPFERDYPYYRKADAVRENIRRNQYSLEHLRKTKDYSKYEDFLRGMVDSEENSKGIGKCLRSFQSIAAGDQSSSGRLRSADTPQVSAMGEMHLGEDRPECGIAAGDQSSSGRLRSADTPQVLDSSDPGCDERDRPPTTYNRFVSKLVDNLTLRDCVGIALVHDIPRGIIDTFANGSMGLPGWKLIRALEKEKRLYDDVTVLRKFYETLGEMELYYIAEMVGNVYPAVREVDEGEGPL